MRKICLVNNFNYGVYLSASLASIEKQTLAFDRVIVVDDGSTDNSREIISSYCDRLAGWESIFKPNEGQLSCFHVALPFVESDDLVTLLDADDLYPADYLERLLEKIKNLKADLYFCEALEFEDAANNPASSSAGCNAADFVIESSSALTRYLHCWIGSPTSAIALRGYLYQDIFPYPHERDWITRADDVIVLGSGLLNARKAYIGSLRIAYRVHGTNSFFGKKFSEDYELRRAHSIEKLFGWFCEKQRIKVDADKATAERELALIPENFRTRFHLPQFLAKPKKKLRWHRKLIKKIRKNISTTRL